MASAAKTITRKAGDAADAGSVQVPIDTQKQLAAIKQLQNTLNALIAAHVPPTPGWIVSGCLVTKDTGALTLDVTSGEFEKVDGTYVAVVAVSNAAVGANASGNPRTDIVQVNTATAAVTVKAGTPAASPVTPTPDAGCIILASFPVINGATEPGVMTDLRPRPKRAFTGAAAAATNLFTDN